MLARSLAEYVTVCNNESGTVEPTYDTNRDEDDVIYRPTTSHMGQQATKAQGSLEARLMRAAQLMPDKDHARKGKVQAVQAGAQAEAGQAAGVERPPWMDIWEERVWEVSKAVHVLFLAWARMPLERAILQHKSRTVAHSCRSSACASCVVGYVFTSALKLCISCCALLIAGRH